MNSDLIEYRFRAAETSGTIRLLEQRVEITVRSGLARWTYGTPYSNLDPNPVRLWTTSSTFWICLLIGALGVFASLSDLFVIEERYMPLWMSPLMLIGALGLLWFAYVNRREEWVMFSPTPTTQGRCYKINFCRNGPDADTFADFTDMLIERINRHTKAACDES
ncbi:MAG: hypothetical protein EA381_17695 [Planctomycetaceae bacterium]|nr:MAG: hypothetical protein EA381_17695 [Planctomycetaceae bacterium]